MARQMTTTRVEVPDAVRGDATLSASMRATTRAIAEAFYATAAGPPPDDRLDWLVDEMDDLVTRSGRRARFFIGLLLFAVSVLAPLFVRKLPPLRSLSRADRARALGAMERSPFGLAIFGVKAPLSIVYYEHPDAARAVGYDASCLEDDA